jgi:hypothetical protein
MGMIFLMNIPRLLTCFVMLVTAFGTPVLADAFMLPGVIPPSACRVGAVVSTEQFTTTGYSNIRTATPNDEIVAGAWVVANDFDPDMSILVAPNCPAGIGGVNDGAGLNLMGVRMTPTITSAAEADIREVKLVWDVNVNGIWDPLLDLVLQSKPGDTLDSQQGAVYWNGPQNPLAFLAATGPGAACFVGGADLAPIAVGGIGPVAGTNSRLGADGCYIALLAIVVIGDNPTTGTQFGLQLEAAAGDIPGTSAITSFPVSSAFSSSLNPQGSNVRLHMVGGSPSSHTPLEHISNASSTPESAVRTVTFSGGESGEGLLTRFRSQEIVPGTREAIALVVGLCDGAELVSFSAPILPAIAGASPTIAGGLASLPCIPSAGTDGYATGINGATLIFRGPLARYMQTVRMYVDECTAAGVAAGTCAVTVNVALVPTTASDTGGGDGFLFQPGELAQQAVPKFNEQTGEAIVQFGGRQEQILFTGNASPIAAGSDFACVAAGTCAGIAGGSSPLLIIFTVDIDDNAPGGIVDVLLGLQSFDDTALNIASAGVNPCAIFAGTAPTAPAFPAAGVAGACASNFLNIGPEQGTFSVEGPEHPSTPNNLAAFDTNSSCFIDDPEFFGMIDGWVDGQIGDTLFFGGVDAWVSQSNVCEVVAGSSVNSLSLDGIAMETNMATSATRFSVSGQNIRELSLEVFGLDGEQVFSRQSSGSHLTWNQSNSAGAPLANGTYLYQVSVADGLGHFLSSKIAKLVILR